MTHGYKNSPSTENTIPISASIVLIQCCEERISSTLEDNSVESNVSERALALSLIITALGDGPLWSIGGCGTDSSAYDMLQSKACLQDHNEQGRV